MRIGQNRERIYRSDRDLGVRPLGLDRDLGARPVGSDRDLGGATPRIGPRPRGATPRGANRSRRVRNDTNSMLSTLRYFIQVIASLHPSLESFQMIEIRVETTFAKR